MLLREGLVEMQFDTNAHVVIEAPAEFQILANDRIGLQYGKIYTIVPKEATGFSVYTPNGKVIDFGTEFGVQANLNNETFLHVIKGKTMLIAGGQSDEKNSVEVIGRTAKRVSGISGTISDIRYNEAFFVRAIDSVSNFIWRGQSTINLADFVGGGNGLGTGKNESGIDPMSGKWSTESWGTRKSANDYHPVPGNPYIDGVFVPDGRTQQVINSQGQLFQECPATSGLCSDSIRDVEKPLEWIASTVNVSASPVKSILLHANMGITFDLEAIRKVLPEVNIARFQSIVGIRRWATRPKASNADFWVLVDGKLRYEKKQVKTGEPYHIDIELSENDRFLTLIETDGGDPEERIMDGSVLSPIDSDWGMFAEPVLLLDTNNDSIR